VIFSSWFQVIAAILFVLATGGYILALRTRLYVAERMVSEAQQRAEGAEARAFNAVRAQVEAERLAAETEAFRTNPARLEKRLARSRDILRRVATTLEAE